ncbi:hypothetical protein [Luteolibacter marinus]|uniref:hypothetical protein n=1 Tax=Luteolibacter marinus TaxID=2776705 RepID=UPI0018661E7A|nr:hypothetical protein [Luteolibacter marinus]
MIIENAALLSRNALATGASPRRRDSGDASPAPRRAFNPEVAKPFVGYRIPDQVPAAPSREPVRQLELRAIFGVDRELSERELIERSRLLPRVVNVARVPDDSVAVVDQARHILGGLGFGESVLQMVCSDEPLVFIREGKVRLAVQTDGGFAPGVREKLIIVARELDSM